LVIDLYSPSFNKSFGKYNLPLSEVGESFGIFTGTLLTLALNTVPGDLLLRLYASGIYNGQQITVDRIEVFPTAQPNNNTQIILSYSENFEAFDRVTGVVLASQQNQQSVVTAFVLYGTLYIVKTASLIAVADNNTTEPGFWTTPRTVSQTIGAAGPYAVTTGVDQADSGEEWSLLFGLQGLFMFNGGQPVKLSEEIQSVINQINWQYGYTCWVKNDIANRRILVGVPLNPTDKNGNVPTWLPEGVITQTNPTTPNAVLELNYKQLNTATSVEDSVQIHRSFSGKLIASDIVRKWSIWTVKAPCAAFMQQANGTTPLFLGNSDLNGKIFQLVDGLLEDDGSPFQQIYFTAGFVTTETGQALQIGVTRYCFEYMTVLISGSGALTITTYPNTLDTPYVNVLLPNINLPQSVDGDMEVPLNECGNRLFVSFSTNAVGAGFTLSRVVMIARQDVFSPVRGTD
jgi:hypothetical protein